MVSSLCFLKALPVNSTDFKLLAMIHSVQESISETPAAWGRRRRKITLSLEYPMLIGYKCSRVYTRFQPLFKFYQLFFDPRLRMCDFRDWERCRGKATS